ncbi:MAG: tetratricopeptide (TPR) repeat protein [Planctomycetota bacterium]|jgi:tetratricopeptide (TPR) repeat protein
MNHRMNLKVFYLSCLLSAWFMTAPAQEVKKGKEARPHPAMGLQLETIDWLEDGAQFLDRQRFKTRLTKKEKDFDRGQLLDQALKRAQEEGRLVLWYIYKVSENTKSGRQMIRAPVLDIAMRQIVWSDPDVERLVKSNFVPLRMVCDEKMSARFGLRPLKFLEPGFVLLNAKGEVLHSIGCIRSFDPLWTCQILRDVLRRDRKAPNDSAQTAIERGEWKLCLEKERASENANSIMSLYRQATFERRMRSGANALSLLDGAQELWDEEVAKATKSMSERQRRSFLRAAKVGSSRRGGKAAAELAKSWRMIRAEEGLVLTRMGRFKEAIKPLREVVDSIDGDRRAEAAYLLAMIRLQNGDEMDAVRRFQDIVQEYPETVFGRRARANVLLGIDDKRPLGSAFSGLERLKWLPEEAFASMPKDTTWPQEKLSVSDAVERGVQFLLRQQRADGGWNDSRYSYCPDTRITANVWMAISAVSCQALLRHRDSADEATAKAIDKALARGERYLADASRVNRGRNEDVYADAYRLDYYVARLKTLPAGPERRLIRELMKRIVREAGQRQDDMGFWAHEYANAFCTAVMAQGLIAAKMGGVLVPKTMLKKAGESIASARSSDGGFAYSGVARKKLSNKSLINSSTRMPMCESVLFDLGLSDMGNVSFAFENFWDHFERIEGVRRTDFHSDGQIAGFMFFHTLYHTSKAISSLPSKKRTEEHGKLLDRVLRYGELDGTFMDSHEMGRSYGTSMALLVIANALQVEK